MKVCLDAGHFGKYNRSPVVPEYWESERMWKLTELLATALKKKGVEVIKTRTNQAADLALVSRGKKADGCDFFLSLHSNAAITEPVDYPVAFVFNGDSKTDIDEKSADIGLKLAKIVKAQMGTVQNARTMKKVGSSGGEYYGVLRGAKSVGVPGVILEHSFHTNTKATKWLLSDANLARLAEAEAVCIVDWLKENGAKEAVTDDKSFRVRVTIKDLNIRTGAGVNYPRTQYIKPGVYTIVEEKKGWGKLKSGAGWIKLSYTQKI